MTRSTRADARALRGAAAVLLTLVLSSPGCTTVDEKLAELATALCARQLECAPRYGFPFEDADSCTAWTACRADERAVNGARDCLDALPKADCADVVAGRLPASCDGLVGAPTAPEGGSCDARTACEPGTFCELSTAACGVCAAQQPAGIACFDGFECLSGRCVLGACDIPGQPGDDCTFATVECVGGFCDAQGFCAPGEPSGSECTAHSECQVGLCLDGSCQPLPQPEIGDPCQLSCASDARAEGESPRLVCEAGSCVEPPRQGEPCSDLCRWDATCLGGTCQPLASCSEGITGSTCESRLDCDDTLFCLDGSCTPQAVAGKRCPSLESPNGGCVDDAFCVLDVKDPAKSTCRRRLSDGESCCDEETGQCLPGSACLGGVCDRGTGTCAVAECLVPASETQGQGQTPSQSSPYP